MVIAAVEGMGGVGKTELAIQYSLLHLQLHNYPGGICWLRARESDIGLQILQFATTDLDKKPPEDLELPERVRWCWQHWQQGNTLIVLDDVNNYSHIKPYLPPQPSQFKVLITTRLKLDLASSLFLEVLSEADALLLLAQLIGEEKQNQELAQAKELCQRLGYLPLALQLVGRYVKKRKITLAEMLRRLEEKGLGHPSLIVKENDPTWTLNIKRGVAAAFELSWQELTKEAQWLAVFLSFFALAEIPWGLVQASLPKRDSEELEDLRDENLMALHLLQRTGEEQYQLHQLIREFFAAKQQQMPEKEEMKQIFCQSMATLGKLMVASTPTISMPLSILNQVTSAIPHLKEAVTTLEPWLTTEGLFASTTAIARFYRGQTDYTEAEYWYKRCWTTAKTRLGEEHQLVAAALNNLARIYQSQGRYQEAEPLFVQSLEIRQRNFGNDHSDVAESLNNLAQLYKSQGRHKEAEPLIVRSLEIWQRCYGNDHPQMATVLNNLAQHYKSQGRYGDAEPLYLKALEIAQRQFGENYPFVAVILINLAALWHSQQRYLEAESLYLQAIEIDRHCYGDDHLEIAIDFNHLASLYQSQGRYSKAESFYQQALEIKRRLLGDNHPQVATNLNNLAALYTLQRRFSDAESLYWQSLDILEQQLGEKHPDVTAVLNNMTELYHIQGQERKIVDLWVRSLEAHFRQQSNDYLGVAQSLNNAAEFCRSQGENLKAEALWMRSLEIYQQYLSNANPDMAITFNNLASFYRSQGRYREAELLFLQAIPILIRTLGDNHSTTKIVWQNFTLLLSQVIQENRIAELSHHPITRAMLQSFGV